jgi:hypothetical protein
MRDFEEHYGGLVEFRTIYQEILEGPQDFKELYGSLLGAMVHIANVVKDSEDSAEKLVALSAIVQIKSFLELRYKQPRMDDFEFFKQLYVTICMDSMRFGEAERMIKEKYDEDAGT